jgi:hypothetical protein
MRARSIELLLPVVLALISIVNSGVQCKGQALTPPLSPTSPQSLQECSQFEAQWGTFVGQLQTAHQNCLDARVKDPNVPGSGSGPGSRCSKTACQALHNVWFSMQSQGSNKVAQCQSEVAVYRQAQQRQQAAAQAAQQAAQQAAAAAAAAATAAARVRNQANGEMLQRAKQMETERNAANQNYQQSASALRAEALQRAAQLKQQADRESQATDSDPQATDMTDRVTVTPTSVTAPVTYAPIQPSTDNVQSVTDASASATQGSSSVPASVDPAAALVEQMEAGPLPETQPSPQPNPVPSNAQATDNASHLTVQDYLAADLSPQAAQEAAQSNSLSAIVAGTKADLNLLTQELAVDPSQQQVQAPNAISPAVTGSQATLDDLNHAQDRAAQQEFASSVVNSWMMVPQLAKCLAEPWGCAGELANDAAQDKAKEVGAKAGEAFLNTVWANMCVDPVNQRYCDTATPAPKPNGAPATTQTITP